MTSQMQRISSLTFGAWNSWCTTKHVGTLMSFAIRVYPLGISWSQGYLAPRDRKRTSSCRYVGTSQLIRCFAGDLPCVKKWKPRMNHMGVSKNRGIPKWMVYNGTPYYIKWMIWGYHYFRKHPIWCKLCKPCLSSIVYYHSAWYFFFHLWGIWEKVRSLFQRLDHGKTGTLQKQDLSWRDSQQINCL